MELARRPASGRAAALAVLLMPVVYAVAQDSSLFAYNSTRLSFHSEPLPSPPAWTEWMVTFPSQVPSDYPENQTVYAHFYEPKQPRGPAVIVLHVLKTRHGSLGLALCRRLAGHGIAALLVELPYHMHRTPSGHLSGGLFLRPDPDALVRACVQSVVDVRCAVDFLASRPGIDPQRIGLVGMSLGAVVAFLVVRVEDRLSVAVCLLGSADPAYVLWHSELVGDVKDALRAKGYSQSDLRRLLAPIDALEYPPRARPCALLMINGLHDWVMPGAAVERTWEGFGRPDRILINSGHFTAFADRGALFRETDRFLRIKFGLLPGPYEPAPLRTGNLKVGVLAGPGLAPTPAAIAEVLPLDTRGDATLELGLTGHGVLAGASCRPFEHLSLGYGLLFGDGRAHGQAYGMVHVTF
jgi:dienelactone hydrolase